MDTRRRRGRARENLFEKVMMENFPILMRQKVAQIQKTQRVPSKRHPKRPTARHVVIKMSKSKKKGGS